MTNMRTGSRLARLSMSATPVSWKPGMLPPPGYIVTHDGMLKKQGDARPEYLLELNGAKVL